MKNKLIIFSVLLFMFTSCQAQKQALKYPKTQKGTVVDNYFGTSIADPYRWLEVDLSDQTAAWVKSQNQVTFDFLNQIPFRNQIKKRIETLWNYEKVGAPFKEGNRTFYYKNDGLQNQSVLYQIIEGKDEVFIDPNTFSTDGTTSLAGLSFSKDGSLVAYSTSKGGSDWNTIYVMDVATKQRIDISITDVKFSGISWLGNEGFYYSSYDKPTGSELSAKTDQHKLYFHKLGTQQKDDVLVFGADIKRRYVRGYVTQDQKYLIISAANSTSGNELYFKDLTQPNAQLMCVVNNFEADFSVLDHHEGVFLVSTNFQSPNTKVIGIKTDSFQQDAWFDIIKEKPEVLRASSAGGYLFANYLKDAVSVVSQYDYDGGLVRNITLPGVGSASGFSAKKTESELYFSFTNYVTPASIYHYDIKTGESKLFQQPQIDFDPNLYESQQVFYTSKDGTKIPMIITYKKGTKLNGKNPTILYGYGGFNISLTPSFSVTNAVWMEMGGIYAVANIRGGGEYGKAWHKAGTQMQKQNVFDDFIAAAQFLIDNQYTSKDFLAIRGGSNGGLLVAACMTQRPDLFKVAIPAVGVLDMLRYHTFTAGAGWAYDYGTAEQSPEMFKYLLGYSPVHNLKKGVAYPSTMVTTADHDDRVVPAHSFKFAATLQENHQGKNPVLIRIDVNAGHGAGKPISMTIQEQTDVFAFILHNMGVNKI